MGLCDKYFYQDGSDETVSGRLTLLPEQEEILKIKKDELLLFIKPKISERFGVDVKHYIQGSYKNRTLIRPIKKDIEYDVDIGIYLIADNINGVDAYVPKQYMREMLSDFCDQTDGAELSDTKENCERIAYKENNFHIDLPLYVINTAQDSCHLATNTKGWIDSDPKKLQDWYQEQTSHLSDLEKRRLRRVIKYIKGWVALKWEDGKGIPSIAITVFSAINYTNTGSDEDLLVHIISLLYEHIDLHGRIDSPINGDDLLGLGGDFLEDAKRKLGSLNSATEYISNHKDMLNALLLWSGIFEHVFPSYIDDLQGDKTAGTMPAVSNPPIIKIKVFDRKGNVVSDLSAERVQTFKDEKLHFYINNSAHYPSGSEVRWIVRNRDREALKINDLGHIQVKDICSYQEEFSVYSGLHYMDCIIISPGNNVLGVKSVKVSIQPYARPVRNPAKKKQFKGFR